MPQQVFKTCSTTTGTGFGWVSWTRFSGLTGVLSVVLHFVIPTDLEIVTLATANTNGAAVGGIRLFDVDASAVLYDSPAFVSGPLVYAQHVIPTPIARSQGQRIAMAYIGFGAVPGACWADMGVVTV